MNTIQKELAKEHTDFQHKLMDNLAKSADPHQTAQANREHILFENTESTFYM